MAEVFDFGLQQHKIKMDGKFFENNLFAVAGDTGRRLEVQLLDSNNMVQNTTGISLRLNADVAGQATYAEARLVDATQGLYELDLPNGMLIAPGTWQFQWQIIGSGGEKLHSFAFMGSIGSNLAEGATEGVNFYLNLQDLKAMQEDLINGTFDSEILETNIAKKLTDLETQYAPKLTEVTAQLADVAEESFYSDLVSHKSQKAMITILDDDTRNELYSVIYPVLQEFGVPLTSAAITHRIEDQPNHLTTITKAQYQEMLASGLVEFISHTENHINLTSLTLVEVEAELKNSKEWIKANGGNPNYIVYPFNGHNLDIRKLTRKYYKGGFSTNGLLNNPPVNNYIVNRVDFESTLAQQKAWIDQALVSNSWVIFNTHSSYPSFTAQGLRDLISYAKSVGIEFVTVEKGMQAFGNLLDLGDVETADNYAVIGADGKVYGNLLSAYKYISRDGITAATPLTAFQQKCVSICHYSGAQATADGFPSAGILFTHRTANDDYSFQQFFEYHSKNIQYRYWNATNSAWSKFTLINDAHLIKGVTNDITALTLPSAMTTEQQSKMFISKITTANATDFPENLGGICTTNVTEGAGFGYQIYHVYNKINVYKRIWDGAAWGAWVRIDFISKIKETAMAVGVVNANSVKELNVTSVIFVLGDSLICNPKFVPPAGVMWSSYIDANGNAKLRVYNATSASVDCGTQNWIFKTVSNT